MVTFSQTNNRITSFYYLLIETALPVQKEIITLKYEGIEGSLESSNLISTYYQLSEEIKIKYCSYINDRNLV